MCDDRYILISSEPEVIRVKAGEKIEKKLVVKTGGILQGFVYSSDGKKIEAQVYLLRPADGILYLRGKGEITGDIVAPTGETWEWEAHR